MAEATTFVDPCDQRRVVKWRTRASDDRGNKAKVDAVNRKDNACTNAKKR
jgi:hypothetical protein